jgi:hypothetical protein
MKNSGLFSMMMALSLIGATILPGVDAFARQSSSAAESAPSSSRDAATASPSSDPNADDRKQNPTRSGVTKNHARNGLLTTRKNSPLPASKRKRAKAAVSNAAPNAAVANDPMRMPGENSLSHRNGITPSVSTSVTRRQSPTPARAIAVNAQQTKSSRDPGAHMAVSGGPANSTHGTAAISGTNMKRKP